MYKVNNIGILRNKFVKKEALKMLLGGPLTIIVFLLLTYISMSKWPAFFFATSPFLLLIGIIGFIVAPIKMIKRHNKTICGIYFIDNKVAIVVFQALWLKSKRIELDRDQFETKEITFSWYGKEKKKGVILRLKNNKEYYFVSDFFSENELIIKNLVK